jgi:5-methylcytosine-specific restriction protein A
MKQPRLTTLGKRVPPASLRLPKPLKMADPIYGSAEWRALIARIIAVRGRRCEDPRCAKPDRGAGGRVYGDHIKELRDGGALLDPSNVMLRCGACHTIKTNAERARRLGLEGAS